MTINEIESIVQSLYKRHENLTEAMLLLLLEAGGWEKKTIKEAIAVYRSLYRKAHEVEQIAKHSLPPLIEQPVLPTEIDPQHLLDERNIQRVVREPKEEHHEVDLLERVAGGYHLKEGPSSSESHISSSAVVEPQSLITHDDKDMKGNEEFPHNLPLKPFETTPHIWSFARYKSIFFGEDVEKKPEEKIKSIQTPSPQYEKYTKDTASSPEPIQARQQPSNQDIHTIYIEKTPLSKDDERLALLTSFMLLAILLLLGYMYSNGRL